MQGVDVAIDEDDDALETRVETENLYNVVYPQRLGGGDPAYPLAAHFICEFSFAMPAFCFLPCRPRDVVGVCCGFHIIRNLENMHD